MVEIFSYERNYDGMYVDVKHADINKSDIETSWQKIGFYNRDIINLGWDSSDNKRHSYDTKCKTRFIVKRGESDKFIRFMEKLKTMEDQYYNSVRTSEEFDRMMGKLEEKYSVIHTHNKNAIP